MKISRRIKELIIRQSSASEIREAAIKDGMVTFQDNANRLIEQGLTTREEIGAVLELEP